MPGVQTEVWSGQGETGGHDADDGVRHAIQLDSFAERAGAPLKEAEPQRVAEDRDPIGAVELFGRLERASENRLDLQNGEQARRHDGGIDALHRAVAREVDAAEAKVAESFEGMIAAPQFQRIGRGGIDGAHLHDAVGMRQGKRAQQYAIDHREHGGGASHAQRQYQYQGGGVAGSFARGAKGVAEVVQKIVHAVLCNHDVAGGRRVGTK